MKRTFGMLLAATAGLVLAPPAAAQSPAAAYGGAALSGGRFNGGALSLLHRPDGRIVATSGLSYFCRRTNYPNMIVRLAGASSPQGFTAAGTKRVTRRGRLRVRMTGTFDGETASGRIVFRPSRLRGCPRFSRTFVLRLGRPPAGGPATQRPGTLLAGVSGQTAAGIPLPVALRVTRNGRRVVGLWQAKMRCGPRARLPAVNLTPRTRIRADGTFSRSERYRIRYADGTVERFRVNLRGRFLADGAVGTLRARMWISRPGARFFPCDSGTRRWSVTG